MQRNGKLLFIGLLFLNCSAFGQGIGPSSGGGGSPTGAAGGGLTGTYPNPTVATNANLTGDVTSVGNATTYGGVVPAAKGGAGTITGALKGNGAGVVTQAACSDLSNASASCSTDATNATNIASGTLPAARLGGLSSISGAITSNTALSNIANYFDGPSIAQGSTGTWFVSGSVVLNDSAGAATFFCKLWDGTSVIASGVVDTAAASKSAVMALGGYMATPASNIKISCRDTTSTSGFILSNNSNNGNRDGTVFAFRIN